MDERSLSELTDEELIREARPLRKRFYAPFRPRLLWARRSRESASS